MASGNDPANVAYIIVDNGFYYVAYKEKVKVPEIVVSSKGVANGLSEEYNDGEIVFIPQYVINPVIEDDNAGRKPDQ